MARAGPATVGCVKWCASERHPEAANLGVNPGAARLGRLERFQNHHRAALAQDHSAAILAERPAGIGSDHAHGLPGLQHSHRQRRFASSGHGHVRIAVAHQAKGLADGVVRRRASCGNRVGRTGESELHGNMARAGIGHGLGNRKRVDASAALHVQIFEAFFDGSLSADGRAADHRAAFAQRRRKLQARILHGLACSHYGKLREAI